MSWGEMSHEAKVEAIERCVAADMRASEIAARLGTSKSTITGFAWRHDVKLLSPKGARRQRIRPESWPIKDGQPVRQHVIEPGENPWAKRA